MPEKDIDKVVAFLSRLTTEEKAILLGAYDRPDPELDPEEPGEEKEAATA